MRVATLAALVAIAIALGASPSGAQSSVGPIDLNASIEVQIERLESMVGTDRSAMRQAVIYHWLIDLYVRADRLADAEQSYRSILAFFPSDIATTNAYARFLMETRPNLPRADSLLAAADAWARVTDPRSVHRARTYTLWGRLALETGDPELAGRRATRSLEYTGPDTEEDALRLRAESAVAMEAWDDAVDAWLALVAFNGGRNTEDINTLKTFVGLSTRYDAGEINAAIADAVDRHQRYRAEAIEAGGGKLVRLTSADGARIEGTLRTGTNGNGVVFVHDVGETRDASTPYEQLLNLDGYTTLSVDLRGHGQSRTDSLPSPDAMTPLQMAAMPDDVAAALHYLVTNAAIDPAQLVVIAIGQGCEIAEYALRASRHRAAVVYISPVMSVTRETRDALSFHPSRPVLVVVSDEDIASVRSLELIRQSIPAPAPRVIVRRDAGHGLDILRREPGTVVDIERFIAEAIARP